ncbi:unnamed protein product [Ectocarpus sp. 12 AP-2014]
MLQHEKERVMWSSKELCIISVATGLVFCFATLYAQSAVSKYVERRVFERSRANPLIGMGLASELRPPEHHPGNGLSSPSQSHPPRVRDNEKVESVVHGSKIPDAPPGSGTRWTPLPT